MRTVSVIVAAVATAGLVGCTAHTHHAAHGATARSTHVSPISRVLARVSPGGNVSPGVAEQLFSLEVAPLPGVHVPAGRSAPVPDATDATDWMVQYRDRLTVPQRAVLDHVLAAKRTSTCTNLPVTPGQPTPGSTPIGAPLPPVPSWVAGEVARVRAFYDAQLGRTLPGPICLDATSETGYYANTTVLPSGQQADGTYTYGSYVGCRTWLAPPWFAADRRDQTWILAHEVFHCFEHSFQDQPFENFIPGWVKEGQASWAANQYARDAGLDASGLEAGHWNEYLGGTVPLFQQSYAAVGFYTSLQQSVDGDGSGSTSPDSGDVWSTLDRMLSVFAADLPCRHGDCGNPGIDDHDILVASKAAFDTAGGDSPTVTDALLARTALDSSLGDDWTMPDPAVPSSAQPHHVTADTLAAGDTVEVDAGGPLTEIHDVQLDAPVVELDAAGWAGLVRLPDGSTRSLADLGDTALFCTSDDCPTDCPDFGDPPVIAGDSLELAATTVTQLTSGTDPTDPTTVLTGFDSCPDPPTAAPSAPDGGASGGGGGSGCSSATDCDGVDTQPCSDGAGECAIAWGDPHLVTFDRRSYDFQAAGEFDASVDPAGGFAIQVRQQPFGLSPDIAVNTAIAMDVAGGRIEVRADDGVPAVLVDGRPWRGTQRAVGDGGRVTRATPSSGSAITVDWPDGSTAWISSFTDVGLNLSVLPSADRGPRLVGLLGNHNGDPGDDIAPRGGAPLAAPNARGALYPGFADSWRVTPRTSLFTYPAGQSTATFTDRSFPHGSPPTLGPVAEATCRRAGVTQPPFLADCALDITVTGQPAAAGASSLAQRSASSGPATSPVAIKTVQVTPTGSATSYAMTLWATDEVTDCAAHAYGAVAAYFAQHPCRHATRYLWTVPFGSRTLAVSVVSLVAQGGPPNDPSRWAAQLVALANRPDTGSVDDLLRDGTHVPALFGARIPADEVFATASEDDGVAVFDGWYLDHGGAPVGPHDPAVSGFLQSLFFTPAAAVHL